jgi:hypothetical protein
MNDIVGH